MELSKNNLSWTKNTIVNDKQFVCPCGAIDNVVIMEITYWDDDKKYSVRSRFIPNDLYFDEVGGVYFDNIEEAKKIADKIYTKFINLFLE